MRHYCFQLLAGLMLLIQFTACQNNSDKQGDVVYPIPHHPAYTNQVVWPYTQAIEKDTEDPELFAQRAAALININCDTLAIIDLRRAIELNSTHYAYYIQLGELLNAQNLPHQAVILFEQVVEKEPQIPAFLGLLKSLIMMKSRERAQEVINLLQQKIPEHPDLQFLIYEYHLDTDKDTLAVIKDMESFLVKYPQAVNIEMLLAETYFNINDDKTVKVYNELFMKDTMDAYPLERIGDFYMKKSDYPLALQYYRKAIKADLNYYFGFYKIAQLYEAQDSLDKALDHYQLAKDINPGFAEAYMGIAEIYKKLGEDDSFKIYKNIALRIKPNLAQ